MSSTGWRRLPSHGESSQDDRPLDGHRPGLAGTRRAAGPRWRPIAAIKEELVGSSGAARTATSRALLRSPRPVNRQGKAATRAGRGRADSTPPGFVVDDGPEKEKEGGKVAGEARGTLGAARAGGYRIRGGGRRRPRDEGTDGNGGPVFLPSCPSLVVVYVAKREPT